MGNNKDNSEIKSMKKIKNYNQVVYSEIIQVQVSEPIEMLITNRNCKIIMICVEKILGKKIIR